MICAVAAWIVSTPASKATQPSPATLYDLESEGIYVAFADPGLRCLRVSLLNPSPANLARLEHRFGAGICVNRRKGELMDACVGSPSLTQLAHGQITVPSLTGLGLKAMQERVHDARLKVTNACSIPLMPDPGSLDDRLRVVRQCPLAGQHVPPGTPVGFQVETLLPGGFRYTVESDDEVVRCGPGQGYMTRAHVLRRLRR